MGSLASYSQILHHFFPSLGHNDVIRRLNSVRRDLCIILCLTLKLSPLLFVRMIFFDQGSRSRPHNGPSIAWNLINCWHVSAARRCLINPALFQCAASAEARGPDLCTNTSMPNKDVSAWIKTMNNTKKKSLLSPVGYFLCLACLHRSLWVSWWAIRTCQMPSGYHTEDVTWGQTRSLWMENLFRLSTLICFVVSRAAFECESFPF